MNAATTAARLAAIANRATRYELVLEHDGRRSLLCYTTRKSGAGLRDAVFSRAYEILAVTGQHEDEARVTPLTKLSVSVGPTARVYFSGRTQRDCILGAELPLASTLRTVPEAPAERRAGIDVTPQPLF